MAYTLLEFLIEEVSKNHSQTSQDIAKNNSYVLLPDGEAILLKIQFPYAIIIEHGEIKLVPNQMFYPYWLAWMVLENTSHNVRGERSS